MKSMHNHCQISKREIMPKVRKAELSFTSSCPVLVSTKYHQIIPKGIRVTEETKDPFFKK